MKKATLIPKEVLKLLDILKHSKEATRNDGYGMLVKKDRVEATDTYSLVRLSFTGDALKEFPYVDDELANFNDEDKTILSLALLQKVAKIASSLKPSNNLPILNNLMVIKDEDKDMRKVVATDLENPIAIEDRLPEGDISYPSYEDSFLDDRMKEIKEGGQEIYLTVGNLLLLLNVIQKIYGKEAVIKMTVNNEKRMVGIEVDDARLYNLEFMAILAGVSVDEDV